VSSGAYMAEQFGVAFSESVMGVGVIAGGPYLCAKYDTIGMNGKYVRCMMGKMGGPQLKFLITDTEFLARYGIIDPIGFIDKQRVYIFSGTKDEMVVPSVVDATFKYYSYFIKDPTKIKYVKTIVAPHSMVTNNPHSQKCDQDCTPMGECKDNAVECKPNNQCSYVNNCGYDSAGALLSHIYGATVPLIDPSTVSVPTVQDNLIAFDQGAYIKDPAWHSIAKEGHIYIPSACKDATGVPCRLHVAFHGCLQSSARVGCAFTKDAGYNAWAEANRIVILYPDAISTTVTPTSPFGPINPAGCWDWFGYDSPGEYYRQTGKQMAAVKRMVDSLTEK
ncbi:MAG: hypothetical protein WCK65_11530, partial [Rhodospirillaceae bacterium]